MALKDKPYSILEARKLFQVVLKSYQQEFIDQLEYCHLVSRLGLDYSVNPLTEEELAKIKDLTNAISKQKTT